MKKKKINDIVQRQVVKLVEPTRHSTTSFQSTVSLPKAPPIIFVSSSGRVGSGQKILTRIAMSTPIVQNSEESQFRANEFEEIESAKMGVDDLPMDDKAKRMRDLLSSFYSPDPSISPDSDSPSSRPQQITLDDINSTSFDPDHYMNFLVRRPIFFNFDSI